MHDQEEALTARPPARGSWLGAGAVVVALLALGLSPVTPRAAAPVASTGPGFILMDLAAIKRAVRERKRPVLVHFWASWCGPCLEELPVIDRFARDVRARGIDFVSLSLDDPGRAGDRVVRILTQTAPSLTRAIVSVDDQDAFIGAIDPRWEGAIPALFAYDSRGQLRGRLIGEASRRDLDGLVSRLVKAGGAGK